jgi:Zn finger protein HypA/HybF involved in hydrogenase expression
MAEADPESPVALGEGKLTFPCEQCGSSLEYSPGSDHLRCPHCGHTQAITAQRAVQEYDFKDMLRRIARAPATSLGEHTIQCEGCGAQAMLAGQAGRCAFCGSPVVMDVKALGEIVPPESVLPFAIDRRRASEAFHQWVRKLWFAPNDLKKLAQVHGIDGVYLPYWTFDSRTTTRYKGMRGDYYYVTESYTDAQGNRQTRQVRKTRWRPTAGRVEVEFDDVLVCASSTLPRPLIEKLEPWDLQNLRGFEAGYLSGFIAERYKIGLEEGFKIADERMQPEIQAAIRSDIGGDEQQILTMSVQHADVRCKHILLPLWISSFRYKEKVYRFIVNARSGEVAGERPWSAVKITLTVLLVIAVIVAIVLVVLRME